MSDTGEREFRGWIFTRNGFVKGRAVIDRTSPTPVVEMREDWSVEPEGMLLPSFVNSHTHLADISAYHRLPEGFIVPDIPRMFGPGGVKHTLLASMSTEETARYIREALRLTGSTGTAMVWDFREGGSAGLKALRMAREGLDVDALPFVRPESPGELEEYPDCGVSVSSIRDVEMDLLKELNRARLARHMPLALHVSEVCREPIEDVLSLEPQVGVHFSEATREDLVRAYENGVYPVFCPRSNSAFTALPPIGWSVDAGIMFGLGTDNAMTCSPDMRLEIEVAFKTALRQVRLEGLNTPTIKIAEAVLMAATYWPRDFQARMGMGGGSSGGILDMGSVVIIKGKIGRPLMYAVNYMATAEVELVRGPVNGRPGLEQS